ncbi:ABC transporter substrate-binding protein [Chitinimonas sp. BJYL2]|uniref:substrate-binding periplasmic protein n=1 Tax=Chitinimonas sp. BJYL2 TaxID=2976696 RepID=UPI0022B5A6FA|nr:hypothetical protein [Chitinimonas sp. BJYL2]
MLYVISRLLMLAMLTAVVQATPIRLCHDDETVRSDPSAHLILMRELQRQSGHAIQLHGRAWTRCLAELRADVWDGAVGASFTPERAEMAIYPMKAGQPDAALSLNIDSYSLYRLREGTASWDGQRFSGIHGLVGVQRGYSIMNDLQAAQLTLDPSASSAGDNLRKLLAGRLVAAVLLSSDAEYAIQQHPDFQQRILRIDPPVVVKPFYLVFSRRFARQHPDVVQQLWQTLPAVRDSAAVRKAQMALRRK